MVERVSGAIGGSRMQSLAQSGDRQLCQHLPEVNELLQLTPAARRLAARLAIDALRDPSDAMIASAMTQQMHYGNAGPAATFRAMIDTALKEQHRLDAATASTAPSNPQRRPEAPGDL